MRDAHFGFQIPDGLIAEEDRVRREDLDRDAEALHEVLRRSGLLSRLGTDLDELVAGVAILEVSVPTTALAARPGRGSIPGAARTLLEVLVDAATVHRLTGSAPRVSLGFPRDRLADPLEIAGFARRLAMGFGPVSVAPAGGDEASPAASGPPSSGAPGEGPAGRRLLEAIDLVKGIEAEGLLVSTGSASRPDGGGLRRWLDRSVEAVRNASARLPPSARLLIAEGSRARDPETPLLAAQALGDRAACVADLASGPAAPAATVARRLGLGKLGGLRWNVPGPSPDPACGPWELFLALAELASAETDARIDRTHLPPVWLAGAAVGSGGGPGADPIEGLLLSLERLQVARAKSLLVDRTALEEMQDRGDAAMAESLLAEAFEVDVRPLVRLARSRKGAPIDPLTVYRRSRYREEKARERRGGGS